MTPVRIQLKRTKGWRMPPNTVIVARPSRWGNTFRIGDTVQRFSAEKICETIQVADAAIAAALHRENFRILLSRVPELMRPALAELRGKNLACWCPIGRPCHADTLLELANA